MAIARLAAATPHPNLSVKSLTGSVAVILTHNRRPYQYGKSGHRRGKKKPRRSGASLVTILRLSVAVTVIVIERADVVIIEFDRRSDAIDRSKLRYILILTRLPEAMGRNICSGIPIPYKPIPQAPSLT